MNPEYLKYSLPILGSALITLLLVLFSWRKRSLSIGYSYLLLMLILSEWLISYGFGVLFDNVSSRIIWGKLEYLGGVFLPFFWIVFAFQFAGNKKWLLPYRLILLSIVPAFLFLLLAFNVELGLLFDHHVFFGLNESSLPTLSNKYWFVIHVVYSLILFLLGTIILWKSLSKSPRYGYRQKILFYFGILIPWFGNITFLIRISPIQHLDISPFTFTLSGLLIAWGLFYNRFVNIVPIARKIVIERMHDGLIVLDSNGLVLDMNPAAQAIFKLSMIGVYGQSAKIVFRDYPELLVQLKYVSRKHKEIHLHIKGDDRFFDLDISPVYNSRGRIKGRIFILHDITELKQSEIKLLEAKKHVEQADDLKSAILANMSHEIRTPMNAIMGFTALLNDPMTTDEERDEFVTHIRNSGTSLLHLIDDIIEISKIDSGQIKTNETICSANQILFELYARFNEELDSYESKNLELILAGKDRKNDIEFVGDPVRITQVLSQLLDNALKFTSKGYVEFGLRMYEPGRINFYVKDTGIGIPREKQQLIFDRFGQVKTSMNKEYSGTGLGLAIVKSLVELLGGVIRVESVFGQGSTFTISLPFKHADSYQPEIKPLEDIEIAAPPKKVEISRISEQVDSTTEVGREEEMSRMDEKSTKSEAMDLESTDAEEKAEERFELEASAFDVSADADSVDMTGISSHDSDKLDSKPEIPEIPEDLKPDLIFTKDAAPVVDENESESWKELVFMIVEYDEMSYLFLELILRKTKVRIVWAKSISQAVSLFDAENRIDLVIMNFQQPDRKGTEAIAEMHEKSKSVPIIVMTAFAKSSENKQASAAGIDNTIPKPIKPDALLSKIKHLLNI